jgi:hypothetical protein
MWTPTRNVVDLTPVIDNLLGYIEANNQDALVWAKGSPGLDPFAAVYPNASGWLKSLYPYVMVLNHADSGKDAEDDANGELVVTTLNLAFEVAVMGKADEISRKSMQYDLALRSMLVNVPGETLVDGCKTFTRAYASEWPESTYDVLRPGDRPKQFMQVFNTAMVYTIVTNYTEI